MTIKVNGNEVNLARAVSVQELLVLQKVNMPEYVTVQLNDEFVSTADFGSTTLKDGDSVEFLYFMGGGQ